MKSEYTSSGVIRWTFRRCMDYAENTESYLDTLDIFGTQCRNSERINMTTCKVDKRSHFDREFKKLNQELKKV